MYLDLKGAMVRLPFVAGPEMIAIDAIIYMKECDIRHLPIVESNKIVGIVSERDLKSLQPAERNQALAEIMVSRPFVVNEREPLSKTVHIMAQQKYGSVLVTNDSEQLVGIFTTTDALILLENLLTGESNFYNPDNKTIPLSEVVSWN